MATLTALYTRIISDTNRDDMGSGGALEQAKIDAVADAIETFASEQFWFNRKSTTVTTTGGTATSAMPTGMRFPEVVSYLGQPLRKVNLAAIEDYYNAATPASTLPRYWAEDAGTIHFYPTPDAAYVMSVYGVADLGVPASGSASNAWTTEAYRLILAEAKVILYRDTLRDVDGATLAQTASDKALQHLRHETRRRNRQLLSSDVPQSRHTFNINTGM